MVRFVRYHFESGEVFGLDKGNDLSPRLSNIAFKLSARTEDLMKLQRCQEMIGSRPAQFAQFDHVKEGNQAIPMYNPNAMCDVALTVAATQGDFMAVHWCLHQRDVHVELIQQDPDTFKATEAALTLHQEELWTKVSCGKIGDQSGLAQRLVDDQVEFARVREEKEETDTVGQTVSAISDQCDRHRK